MFSEGLSSVAGDRSSSPGSRPHNHQCRVFGRAVHPQDCGRGSQTKGLLGGPPSDTRREEVKVKEERFRGSGSVS